MNSYILSEIEKEFKHINNKEITNLKYDIIKTNIYDTLNIAFDKDGKHISVMCTFNYILYKLFVSICVNPDTNKIVRLSYSNKFLKQCNDMIVKEILNNLEK